jgi:hypothetical protein
MNVAMSWMPPPTPFASAGQELEEIDERAAEVVGEQEHQVHGEEKDRDAQGAVEDDAVDAVRGTTVEPGGFSHHLAGEGVDDTIAAIRHQNVESLPELCLDGLLALGEHRLGSPSREPERQLIVIQEPGGQPAGVELTVV